MNAGFSEALGEVSRVFQWWIESGCIKAARHGCAPELTQVFGALFASRAQRMYPVNDIV